MSRSPHLRDHHTCPDSADPHTVKTNEYLLYIDPSVVLETQALKRGYRGPRFLQEDKRDAENSLIWARRSSDMPE
jgi:hypothetical protein